MRRSSRPGDQPLGATAVPGRVQERGAGVRVRPLRGSGERRRRAGPDGRLGGADHVQGAMERPDAAVRVGRVEGAWILNPTFQQLEFSDVDMVVSGSKDSIVMVEGGALELTEAEIVKGLEVAHKGIRELLDAANELVADMRQPKMEWTKVEPPAELVARVKQLAEA